MWTNLLVNLANISLLILFLQLMLDQIKDVRSKPVRLMFGVICGLCACVSMSLAEPIRPGFIFDLRGPLIACAAFFGGPLALVPAGVIASGFRFQMEGAGWLPGILSIWAIGGAALAVRLKVREEAERWQSLGMLVLAVVLAFNASYVFVPAHIRTELYLSTALPATVLMALTTLLIAMLLEREVSRKALAQSNTIYRQMVDSLPDCLNAKDLSGRFLAANPATARLMRAGNAEDLIGRTDFDFYDSDVAKGFRREEESVMQSGIIRRFEQEVHVSENSNFWMSTLKVPLRDANGRMAGVITHNRDIGKEVKMARMKSEFISTVSHELRTPLTSIRGALSLVASGIKGDVPPDVMRLVTMAKRNSERLVLLINDLLDIDKLETGKMKFNYARANLEALLHDVVASNANYRPDMKVTTELVSRAPELTADVDVDRMAQVVANVLSNAIKYSPVGGRVRVLLEQPCEDTARITIADEGRGVPDEFRERIFGKFEQVDSSDSKRKEGTGLGLHISRRIIEDMGGRIALKTGQRVGAAFEIEVPLRNPALGEDTPRHTYDLDSMLAPAQQKETATACGWVPRVLYVEDDKGLGEYVAQSLAPQVETMQVVTLTEAKTAVAAKDFDLVILDRNLPDGSGFSLIEALPEDLPIVAFTAEEFEHPLHARITSRMIKTLVNEEDLANEIRRLLRDVPIRRPACEPVNL